MSVQALIPPAPEDSPLRGGFLRAAGAPARWNTPLFFEALGKDKQDIVTQFLEAGFNPNTYDPEGNTGLHIAAKKNLVGMGRLLLNYRAVPALGMKNRPLFRPLEISINTGHSELTGLFAPYGVFAPENAASWPLLHRAAGKGDVTAIEALAEAGTDLNALSREGTTALMVAVQRKQVAAAEKLLDYPEVARGINEYTSSEDPKKRNAFQMAVAEGLTDLAEKMIQKGAFVNQPDAEGRLPVDTAIMNGDTEMVKMLARNGADMNAPPRPDNEMPALLAVRLGRIVNLPLLKAVLEANADPNVQHGKDKKSPLIEAVLRRSKDAVRLLLEADADPSLKDAEGRTALDYAGKNQEIREMLEEALKKQAPAPQPQTETRKYAAPGL